MDNLRDQSTDQVSILLPVQIPSTFQGQIEQPEASTNLYAEWQGKIAEKERSDGVKGLSVRI